MYTLPDDASGRSRELLALAQELAARCPASLATEIAVSGSVARGVADQYSDLEVNLWAERVPDLAERSVWLHEIADSNLELDVLSLPPEMVNSICRYQGVWIELAWQPITPVERLFRDLLVGADVQSGSLQLAEAVTHALPLRTEGKLAAWQGLLAHYPDVVQRQVIESRTADWNHPLYAQARWAAAQRRQQLAFTEQVVSLLNSTLSILFAISHEWEPTFKWLPQLSSRLSVAPQQMLQRVDASSPPTSRRRDWQPSFA